MWYWIYTTTLSTSVVQGKRVRGGKSGVGREKEIKSAQRERERERERGDTEGYSQERQEIER